MSYLFFVAAGGAVGAMLRYGAVELAMARGATQFPWATLMVNLMGSALLAFITAWAADPETLWERQPSLRVFATVGLLGAFTTYSTFNLEVLHMAMAGRWRAAAVYLSVTAAGAVACGIIGIVLGRSMHA